MSTGRHLEAREAELAVLGAIFLDNAAFDRIGDVVTADDFYAPRHRTIFQTMLALAEQGEPIDTVTVATALERENQLEDVGGMEYLASLDQVSASAVNVAYHAEIVHDMAEVRRLMTACADVMGKA